MNNQYHKAVAIVGVGAVMPDAHNLPQFWSNIKNGVYSISDVPAERWQKSLYYDADRKAPDKAYSTIGGWVRSFDWDPIKWRLPIPPKVGDLMDLTQKYAIAASREALLDFDYENKDFDRERTAVIFGNAMGGDQHLYSAARALFPEFAEALKKSDGFKNLPAEVRKRIIEEMNAGLPNKIVPITEDTMPGELSNIAAGRIAALFNLRGMNYVTDAACASAMAGVSAAVNGLLAHDYDLVLTGGTDANMSPSTFIKFCKIGALSARDSRPYAEGADGFVMGEGAAVFVMKRLEDAERDGDKIYAVFRSMGGSSDGKGKGITAPNPVGQILAVKRAYERIGLAPTSVGLIEGHGTSTTVGDAAELQSMAKVFEEFGMAPGSIALGSVKGNIGHLKGGAGAAGIMKATMALHEKVLPPSLNFHAPNPNVDFNKVPFKVNTELRPWELKGQDARRCGVSAFGFGGTNFHAVLEEYIPGKLTGEEKKMHFMASVPSDAGSDQSDPGKLKKPIQGIAFIGAKSEEELIRRLEDLSEKTSGGWTPDLEVPLEKDLQAEKRIAIDYANAEELNDKIQRALKALKSGKTNMWKVLNAKGVFYGSGKPGKAAFLFTGQGSQYVNMLRELKNTEPVVEATFKEADEIMTPLLGKPLTEYIFIDESDQEKVKETDEALMQTEITQPAMLTADTALYRLMGEYGVKPDMVIGHSLGEYGALVASGALEFKDALLAVSARGHQMAKVKVEDKGMMAAIFASPEQINEVLKEVDGYAVIANINCYAQSVVGGATSAVKAAMKAAKEKGYRAAELPVSHAFHTEIVAPASSPLWEVLADFDIRPPIIPIISNVTGDFYPDTEGVKEEMLDLLSKQVASPVQFVKGINKLYDRGARVFAEMGPKKALNGFVRDILGSKDDVSNLFTNHPKIGAKASFNQALCGMYAAGLGRGRKEEQPIQSTVPVQQNVVSPAAVQNARTIETPGTTRQIPEAQREDRIFELGKMFVDFLEQADKKMTGTGGTRSDKDIWITGAAMGLPGVEKVFSDDNLQRILRGDQFIQMIPKKYQEAMLAKNVTRLMKTGKGGPRFVTIDKIDEVIKLAGRRIDLDIVRDFDFPKARMEALDEVSALAIGAGIDALRDAGIPMVMNYKETSKGSKLPDRWLLPADMRDDTGIIFASAFPGYNQYATQMTNYFNDKISRGKLETLIELRDKLIAISGTEKLIKDVNEQIDELSKFIEDNTFVFDRRFLFQVLAMGHSQFAEYIGARGPNSSMNAACASTTQAVAMARDWIQMDRCNRVLVIAADDITGENTLEWFASGFIATGAAATDDRVEDAALPFDRRRHGMIIGMGGASLVVENREVAEHRGITPIAEVLSTVLANSAFHGTRLDVSHIKHVMEKLISDAEKQWGIDRNQIASETVFISHETYTPARGGSAAAEVDALNHVFKDKANQIVIANTKGFTGHPMGVGIEDVIAVKILETGMVPPIPNFKEVDPDLGNLNLSKGGSYPVKYALRLAAGFGSQISMTLYRWFPTADGNRRSPEGLNFEYRIRDKQKWQNWLKEISGKEHPEVEVYKRTLRVKDEFASNGEGVPVVQDKPEVEKSSRGADALQEVTVQASDPVQEEIMQLISTKTGYPADMLDIDLDLEADLGIDTVKQAELFADIRGSYDIPQDDSIVLSDFPTLKHIMNFVYEKRPDLANKKVESVGATSSQVATEKTELGTSIEASKVMTEVLALIAEKTGYPVDMLDPALDLEADLGIDTVKQAELFADIRGLYDIPQDDSIELSAFPTLQHIIGFVYEKRPDLAEVKIATAKVESTLSATREGTSAAPPASSSKVVEEILNLIAEKTGYPPEMLDPDLDLEADLGIDTVKQAELFADIRGLYDIPQDDSIELSAFPTLQHIIEFVYEKRPDLKTAPSASLPSDGSSAVAESSSAPSSGTTPTSSKVTEEVLVLIAEKTGYPPEMLDLDLDLEADLGIDTVKQAELFADIRGLYDIPQDDNIELSAFPTLQHIIDFVFDKRPDLKETVARTDVPVYSIVEKEDSTANAEPRKAPSKVTKEVLVLIAEKTGYPPEMLDLDLDLEADLGIDTVKQAELFADIRGLYDIPQDDSIELSEFPTLQHIIDFVYDKRPDLLSVGETVAEEKSSSPQQSASSGEAVVKEVLALIAEKTGYPPEMLDLDLDLEADLGIDTVKQAELFADIRGLYNIPQDDSIELSDYPTLNHIIAFVNERSEGLSTSTVAEETEDKAAFIDTELMQGDWEAIAQIPRRIPTPVLRPDLELCKSTGVELKGTRVIIKKDEGKIGDALIKLLEKEGVEILEIDQDYNPEKLDHKLEEWCGQNKINGVYWLPALDKEKELKDIAYDDWKAMTYGRVKMLYHTMRKLELMGQQEVFLVSATRLGGQFGYDQKGAIAPMGGAVAGFTKAYKRENPESLVKVIDFEVTRKTKGLAELIIAETLSDTGIVELGYQKDQRWTVGLVEEEQLRGENGMKLDRDSVYLITGGAGSITSAITADLAKANGGIFHLLDLTPEPDRKDPDIEMFNNDKEGLKRILFDRLKEAGEKPTPVNVEKLLSGIERKHAALSAIHAIESAGASVHYHSVNLLDNKAVKAVINKIVKKEDKIDVFMHAGGLEISRMLKDKEASEFNLVFDVKVDGWYNILSALGDFPLHAAVVFSSIAGRFGNGGQVDYSAANDFLCKSISAFKWQRKEARGIALDWTAWGGIGMAARGSIPMVMKQAGIDMLPPEAGIPFVRKELIAGKGSKEVVVAQSLGLMLKEFDDLGGVDIPSMEKKLVKKQLMVQKVRQMGLYGGLIVSAEFDPKKQAFLFDHQINEVPVLPGVMGIEAMTSAARSFLPDMHVSAVSDVSFFAPFKFYKNEPREVFVSVIFLNGEHGLKAHCELYGLRSLLGQEEPQKTTHFKATVHFSEQAPEPKEAFDKKWLKKPKGTFELDDDEIYKVYFHGPAYQVVDEAWKNKDYFIAEMEDDLPENHQPSKMKTESMPRLIEHCFQAAGIHLLGTEGVMGLPAGAKSVKWYQSWDGKSKVFAVIEKDEAGYHAMIVDKKGERILEVEAYTTAEFPMSVSDELLEPFKKVVE
jgi:malonyl CoA-acyl carrier protein transacylase